MDYIPYTCFLSAGLANFLCGHCQGLSASFCYTFSLLRIEAVHSLLTPCGLLQAIIGYFHSRAKSQQHQCTHFWKACLTNHKHAGSFEALLAFAGLDRLLACLDSFLPRSMTCFLKWKGCDCTRPRLVVSYNLEFIREECLNSSL